MKTVTENNKIIAEFMGEKLPYKNKQNEWEFYVKGAGKVSSTNIEDLDRFLGYNYNTNWNALIPAITKLNEDMKSSLFKTDIFNNISSMILVGDINGTYQYFIEGLKSHLKIS